MRMKVALSASYWDNEEVQRELKECDVIYTTNVRARDELWGLFGENRVRFIPCSTPEMLELVKSWYLRGGEDVEFIEFNHLFEIVYKRKRMAQGA